MVLYYLPCRVAPDGSTLKIFKALTSDRGKYTCVATNPAGEEDQIFSLSVYGEFSQIQNWNLVHNLCKHSQEMAKKWMPIFTVILQAYVSNFMYCR